MEFEILLQEIKKRLKGGLVPLSQSTSQKKALQATKAFAKVGLVNVTSAMCKQ